VARLSKDYTTVKDPEAHYYLGLVYQMQGRYKEAVDHYWKATWYPTFQHPAYLALAQIASIEGLYDKANQLLTEAIYVGARDTKALTFQAWLLRKSGQEKQAADLLKQALAIDPLDYWSLSEQSILSGKGAAFLDEADNHRGEGLIRLQELLEIALDYGNIGAYKEAGALLDEAIRIGEPYTSSPLVYYYNGYYKLKAGQADAAATLFRTASQQPSGFCFPFRLEETDILLTALQTNPADSRGAFYLGNLLYYLDQKADGIAYWEKAVQAEPLFARAHRNLGFGYSRANETAKAIASYEQSVKADPTDPRVFLELDQLYEQAGKPAKERLALLEKNVKTVLRHDDAVIRLLTLYNETGAYDKSIRIVDQRHFHVWEGGGQVHGVFVDAHLLQGIKLLKAKKYSAAIKEFETADLYPDNLEVGRPAGGGHSAKGFYYMGEALKQMGNAAKANECFETAAQSTNIRIRNRGNIPSEELYFRALALRELGRASEADNLIKTLKDGVSQQLSSQTLIDEYSKFGEDGSRSERLASLHYLNGLVFLAQGDEAQAHESFRLALRMNQNLIWPKQFLAK
jgi:tetratricopeptide (TPR) repeat protein